MILNKYTRPHPRIYFNLPTELIVVSALNVGLVVAYVLKVYSFAHVMQHIRRFGPRAIELEKQNKNVVEEIGADRLSPEVNIEGTHLILELGNIEKVQK